MKKTKDEVIFETLINKMLEPHGVTIDDIRDNERWFTDYTWTYKESLDFRNWAIKYLTKAKKLSYKIADRELMWFNLSYGLKYSDDPHSEENRKIAKEHKFYW